MIRSQAGFSLIEIFVATALVGILSVAGMEMMRQQNDIQVSTESSFDALDIANEIRTVLGSSKSCTQTFVGQSFSNGTVIPKIVQSIKDPTSGAMTNRDYMKPNEQRGQRLKVKSFILIDVDVLKGSASLEVTTEGVGNNPKTYIRRIPLTVLANVTTPTLISSCVTLGGPPVDPVELCDLSGGVFVNGKCNIEADLDTGQLPTYCPPGSTITFDKVNDRPHMTCTACATVEKFEHWDCGKPFSGMNWINMCYYTTVCASNSSIQLFGSHWDVKVGPSSAPGNDTTFKSSCKNKRNKCVGEP